MNPLVSYIIRFLIDGDKTSRLAYRVGYTSDVRDFHKYNVVIVPSSFFRDHVYGTPASMPQLPLNEIEGVPLLFGSPEIKWHSDTLIVHADIIAGAYFLLSRYEEIRKRHVRDEYGRFPGKESLPYQAGFIHRPVVDEYGKLLRNWLRETGVPLTEPTPQIQKIWLTHDVDAPFYCRTLRNVMRETIKGKGIGKALSWFRKPLEEDPYYTFPWLTEQDNTLVNTLGIERSEAVYFLKAGGCSAQDKPHYHLHTPDGQALLKLLQSQKASLGLHASYDAGKKPSLITHEHKVLGRITGRPIRYNRHHYLACREPEDYIWLERAGITDDFTMGYPDVAGFRLGTSHPVRWINPGNRHLSSLRLHPLSVMDVALSEQKYMGLSYDEAYAYCLGLINQVEKANGELVLLWHNDSVSEMKTRMDSASWHRQLYAALIEELRKR
ncbi:hypothetical protein M2459_002938 [Parabacteroides sp. PF5-5]|uniref:polysaccharide deacetylase family protein n=1 Tax=unclassified Parabacteroides TaxID=2649774 RepID=UPI002473C168|nr:MULTISPECIES: polysaccharide deacetylase family protein [unclassified Parabacteroides]MDH6306224.1 hypothetical protein [Parabacteroides sp. PH5-39]MDH6317183.1 hypothetical protein [Parabacteroides sp. PF5-13]MDH6320936.1 hypothetical protein [Parabacteroides sp. PH5-13]MDH6324667.1 hypothetical protein [Parabacteroides sp. PH5-8]MDH6328282.1 hypothetical protein [Parabacteroides sp. PH5-41]